MLLCSGRCLFVPLRAPRCQTRDMLRPRKAPFPVVSLVPGRSAPVPHASPTNEENEFTENPRFRQIALQQFLPFLSNINKCAQEEHDEDAQCVLTTAQSNLPKIKCKKPDRKVSSPFRCSTRSSDLSGLFRRYIENFRTRSLGTTCTT